MKTRREFISCGTCTLLLLGCGDKGNQTPIPSVAETGLDTGTEEPGFDPCSITVEDGWTEVPLSSHPELQDVGGYVTTTVGGNTMVIAHVTDGCYAAVSSTCTHQGGAIFYSASRNQFSCLLHAATFDLDGEWALGQVTSNLQSFLVAKEGDSLWVNV